MGQQTIGLVFGVACPSFLEDLEIREKFLEAFYQPKKVPCLEHYWVEDDPGVLGVCIAAGATGSKGAAYLDNICAPLANLEKELDKEIERAKVIWGNFSKFLQEKGFPPFETPQIWILPMEVW